MANYPTPHDSFFKSVLQHTRIAKEFLQTYLPSEIKKIADLNYLDVQKETFIDEHRQLHACDVLYGDRHFNCVN